eukprot:COSAG04_NODE_1684_length_5957_cov_83.857631_6_plen_308_part_00
MYPEIHRQLNEFGTFDDIVASGVPQAQGAKAAIVFSKTADMYFDSFGTAGAAKRSLFVMLRHAQIATDVIVEEDMESGLINEYGLIFLSEAHLRESAAAALVQWVGNGGTLFGSVGMGMLNQFNDTSTALAQLYGIKHQAVFGTEVGPATSEISFVKQGKMVNFLELRAVRLANPQSITISDLQYATVLDTATPTVSFAASDGEAQNTTMLVLGEKAVLSLASPPSGADTLARFSDGSPALFRRSHGEGAAIVAAFHLGFSYFHPALPKRPVARGSTDETFNHFVRRLCRRERAIFVVTCMLRAGAD